MRNEAKERGKNFLGRSKATFVNSLSKFILSTYNVPAYVLGPGDTVVIRKDKNPCLCDTNMLMNSDFIL